MHEHHHNHSHVESNMTAEELTALIEYTFNHNAAHLSQLEEISQQLKDLGNADASEIMLSAVKKYSEANNLLKEAIEKI